MATNERIADLKIPVILKLKATKENDEVTVRLLATQGEITLVVEHRVASKEMAGGVSLLTDGPRSIATESAKVQYRFSNFEIGGDRWVSKPERSFGPIVWSQYTLDQEGKSHQLRLQAQLAPLGPNRDFIAELWTQATGEADWTAVDTATMDKLSRTVAFSVEDWDAGSDQAYEVCMKWQDKTWTWPGTIRAEPNADQPLKLGCFSCDNGYLFRIPPMVAQVQRQDPDMLFFAGDQIYESYGGFGVARNAETSTAMLDYLRKFYQFGWTWRDVMRDRPTVLLPDDHDVFQGNLWGHGGRKLPSSQGNPDFAAGGYLMPPDWVRAVERTHAGHLPPPANPEPLPSGIETYYTDLTYGGIGFAILEDRKFKTGPNALPENAVARGDGAALLGEKREEFLRVWAGDWEDQHLKCVLSQTIFCHAATHTGQELKRSRFSRDNGGWPIEARNRAVRIMGDSGALSIHGDKHLGVLLRQGVEDFDDANYAFMVPGTANGFPRAWWPVKAGLASADGKTNIDLGKFHDSYGHPIRVLAAGNPEPGSNLLAKTTNDPMTIGYRQRQRVRDGCLRQER